MPNLLPHSAVLASLFLNLATNSFGMVVFEDMEMGDGNWTVSTRTGPNTLPVIASASQTASGGNSGAFRETTHSVSAVGPGFAFGWFWHLNTSQTYDPSAGAILSLDHLSQHQKIGASSSQGTTTYVVVEQDGNIYFSSVNQVTNSSLWSSFNHPGLTAANFSLLKVDGSETDEALHPDFSETGGQLSFGVGFSNTPNSETFAINHGIDNWSVTLDTVPEPSTFFLGGLTLLCATFRRLRL